MANFVSSSALPIQLNGTMLGGMVLNDTSGRFYSLKGGLSGNYDDTLSGTINNQSIIGALNSIAAGDALAVGVSGSLQVKGASGFDGGKQLLYSDGPTNAGLFLSLPLNVSGAALFDSTVSGAAGTFDALAGTSLALQGGGITAAGAVAGATTIDASGKLTVGGVSDLDGGINVDDTFTVSTAGAVAGVTTLAASGLANLNGGIEVDSGGNKFTVSEAGAVVAEGSVSGAAGNFDAITGVSLALQGGGISAAGAVAGATTIDASGKMTIGGVSDLDGGIDVNASKFTVSTAGAVVADSTVSGAAGTFDALGATTLALQGGGITAAGAIAGATTINASGLATVGGLTDGIATIAVGLGTGFRTLTAQSIPGSVVSATGSLFALGTCRTELSGALAVSGAARFSAATVFEAGMDTKGQAVFRGTSIFGAPGVAGSTLTIMGSNEAGTATAYRLSVTGGILSVQSAQ